MGWSHLMVRLVTPVDWDNLQKSHYEEIKTAQKGTTTAALVKYLNVVNCAKQDSCGKCRNSCPDWCLSVENLESYENLMVSRLKIGLVFTSRKGNTNGSLTK